MQFSFEIVSKIAHLFFSCFMPLTLKDIYYSFVDMIIRDSERCGEIATGLEMKER